MVNIFTISFMCRSSRVRCVSCHSAFGSSLNLFRTGVIKLVFSFVVARTVGFGVGHGAFSIFVFLDRMKSVSFKNFLRIFDHFPKHHIGDFNLGLFGLVCQLSHRFCELFELVFDGFQGHRSLITAL